MAINTYATLKSSIADFLNRDDLTSVIPTFITLAESKFNRAIRTRQMVKRATATVDGRFFAMPADFLESRSFQLNTNPITVLEYVTEGYGNTLNSTVYQSSGRPKKFTVVGTQLEVIPAPDSSYESELTYYAKIAALSDDNTSNWLLTSNPDIYLYGALLQSAPYLKDDARIAVWSQLYTSSVDELNVADQRASVASSIVSRAKTFG
jgi:hypothetical protein